MSTYKLISVSRLNVLLTSSLLNYVIFTAIYVPDSGYSLTVSVKSFNGHSKYSLGLSNSESVRIFKSLDTLVSVVNSFRSILPLSDIEFLFDVELGDL